MFSVIYGERVLLRLLSRDKGTSEKVLVSAAMGSRETGTSLSKYISSVFHYTNDLIFNLADFVDVEWSSTLPGSVRLRGGQRGRAIVSRGWGDHRDERADRRRQLDGGCIRTSARQAGHVPDQLRAHVAGLTLGKPELVGERLQHCQLDERCQSWPQELAKKAEGVKLPSWSRRASPGGFHGRTTSLWRKRLYTKWLTGATRK